MDELEIKKKMKESKDKMLKRWNGKDKLWDQIQKSESSSGLLFKSFAFKLAVPVLLVMFIVYGIHFYQIGKNEYYVHPFDFDDYAEIFQFEDDEDTRIVEDNGYDELDEFFDYYANI